MNYLANNVMPSNWSSRDRKKFMLQCRCYCWDDPYLFRIGKDGVLKRYVSEEEQGNILFHCHDLHCGSHFGGQKTAMKILQAGFYWPTLFRDAHAYYLNCDRCQRIGNMGKRNKMLLVNNLVIGKD